MFELILYMLFLQLPDTDDVSSLAHVELKSFGQKKPGPLRAGDQHMSFGVGQEG